MHKLLQVVIVLMLTLVGCRSVVVGDALLTIKGRLVLSGTSSQKCTLGLSLIDEKTAAPYDSRFIGSEYFVDFAVVARPAA
jgi:hypothetical protein